jgi:hypothetical protein
MKKQENTDFFLLAAMTLLPPSHALIGRGLAAAT